MNQPYLEEIYRNFTQKMLQYLIAIAGGLLAAFESTIPFFIPCAIAIILDIYTAYKLGKRVKKKYPDKADGKFRSSYWKRVSTTMIFMLLMLILANYVDTHIFEGGKKAEAFCFGVFIFYQCVSMLENWSSENNSKAARALQKIFVNKAERHFNVDFTEIFEVKEEKKENENGKS